MVNTSSASAQNVQNMSKCNSCSQNGMYFSFGKRTDAKLYALIKGKQRRVYVDLKGRYYKQNSKKKYLPRGTRTYKLSSRKKSPLKKVKDKKVKDKKVKDKKEKSIRTRVSARVVFNQMGTKVIGKSFSVLQKDGTYKTKYLRLRKNGSPYFSNSFGKKHPNDGAVHLNFLKNKNWLRGPYPGDDMTGLKNSWPNYSYDIPPAGVAQPFRTSLLPRISAGTRRGNNYGNSRNIPHMHYGKMCFGA